jgi:hypothetical protein
MTHPVLLLSSWCVPCRSVARARQIEPRLLPDWFDDRYFSFQRGGVDRMQYLSSPVHAKQNLQRLEEVLYDLPPLEGVFLHWHTYGLTSMTPGVISLLSRRRHLLGAATLSGASLQLLAACATDALYRFQWQKKAVSSWESRPLHARVVRHDCSLSAVETQALLPPGVLVQKTVLVALADTPLLCTGLGTQTLKRWHLQAVAAALALSGRAVKACRIHAEACGSVEAFAMQPDMVSPFLHPSSRTGLAALVLLPGPRCEEEQVQEVAVSLSLWESLLLPAACLRPLIRSYAARVYPELPVLALASEETADEYTATLDA